MSILEKIIGGSVAQPVEAVGNVIKAIWGDKTEKLSHEQVMAKLALEPGVAQVELNKVEAAHRSIFVAGWRPFIGWIAGIGLAFFFIPQYVVATWIWLQMLDENGFTEMVAYPTTADGLLELVIAMLGLGGLRTLEKLSGKAK